MKLHPMLGNEIQPFRAETKIGDYTILGELGRGGMGIVFEALDPSLDRTVALKVLPGHLAEDPEYVARFTQEARAAARLNHPNIVTIYQFGWLDGRHTMAMEYVQGTDLSEIIAKRAPISIGMAVEIARQIASALGAAHRVGIVHRDIKPRNIMVDPLNRVKVMDFGIAKVSAALSTVETADGKLIGTPAYMSPEQIVGRPADHRSDLYSLGVVLYQMLAGRTPFVAETPGAMLHRVLNELPTPIEKLNPDVPSPLAACVRRALAKEPQRRYQNAQEFLAALDAIAPGETVVASYNKDTEKQILALDFIRNCIHSFPQLLPIWFESSRRLLSRQRLLSIGTCFLLLVVALVMINMSSGSKRDNVEHVDKTEIEPPVRPAVVASPAAEPVPTTLATADPVSVTGHLLVRLPTAETQPSPDKSTSSTAINLGRTIALYTGVEGSVDASEAKTQLMRAAEAGDPVGQMWCAWFSHWGNCGFDKNEKRARHWAALSLDKVSELAAQGDLDAIFLFGGALDLGLGRKADPAEAARWVAKAADAGHTTAMNYMGYAYYVGQDTPEDLRTAFEWFYKAARVGDVNAMHNLGWMYARGQGVEKDDAKALEYFRKGAGRGSAINMNDLGWMYEQGRGVAADRLEAIGWYRKAARLGDRLAAENLQKLGKT